MNYPEEYVNEQTELFEWFLENSFYKAWRDYKTKEPHLLNYKHFELMINHKCNLKCKYCYMDKYHKAYFPKGSQNPQAILENTDMLIDWFAENGFAPKVEIFAGDSLNDPTCRKVIHKFLDACLEGRYVTHELILPTNGGWLLHENKIRDVEAIREKAEFAGVYCHFSFSVDGKYMDKENRPFKSDRLDYSDEFYHRMFSFMANHFASGPHPMVYSNNIENAKKNFLWWQEQMEKYNLPWNNLYMLEVRNAEWTVGQTQKYTEFIEFLLRWVWDKLGQDKARFVDWISKEHGFNIIGMPFAKTMRGMPCSIQSCMTLRLGDLTVIPCHRTAYKHMETAKMLTEDGKITGFEAKNIELWFAIQAIHNTVYPFCEGCNINNLCSGGCLGAQYEATGSLFTPIPSVCRLVHAKIATLVKVFLDFGVYTELLVRLDKATGRDLERIRKYITEDTNV
jgi:radical SAM protein with 4Fe4S-binding SPASM domain